MTTKIFLRISLNDLKRLLICIVGSNFISALVTRILSLKSTDPTADTSALEAEIDVLVFKLYCLTYGEVLEPDFGLSEEEYVKITIG